MVLNSIISIISLCATPIFVLKSVKLQGNEHLVIYSIVSNACYTLRTASKRELREGGNTGKRKFDLKKFLSSSSVLICTELKSM